MGVSVGVFEFKGGGADLGLSAVTYSLGHSQQLSAPRNQPELGASQLTLLRFESVGAGAWLLCLKLVVRT